MSRRARFRVVPAPSDPGVLHGAWWPRSLDLSAEAPALLAAVGDARNSHVTHFTYDPGIWQPHPAAIDFDGHRVQAGRLAADETNQVALTLASRSHLILAVIRPDTNREQAEWVLQRSVERHNTLTPSRLLELADLVARDDGVDRWVGDGGSTRPGPTTRQPRQAGSERQQRAGAQWTYEASFPPEPRHVREARAFVARHLSEARLYSIADAVRLVVSELATNAVIHAATPFTVLLSLSHRLLRLEVRDHSPGHPRSPVQSVPTSTRGRGLQVVEAVASSWGVRAEDDGKSVWAVFDLAVLPR